MDFEREEWRGAVAEMGEVERVQACGHTFRLYGVCYDCGDGPDE